MGERKQAPTPSEHQRKSKGVTLLEEGRDKNAAVAGSVFDGCRREKLSVIKKNKEITSLCTEGC